MLAEENNLALLADEVGLEITVDETESKVGDFNVDNYATETGNELKLTDKGNGKFAFTMPASKVEVKADFTEDTSETTFSPDSSCTRAQAVTFLWRAAGCPEPKNKDAIFTDVAENSYYYDAVLWSVEQGITNGTSETNFSTEDDCTRAQIVTFLYRNFAE